jgi:hypothetical protein
MQFSLASCHFISLRFKYSPQHCVPRHPQSVTFIDARHEVSHPYKITGEVIALYYFNLYVFS